MTTMAFLSNMTLQNDCRVCVFNAFNLLDAHSIEVDRATSIAHDRAFWMAGSHREIVDYQTYSNLVPMLMI